LLGKKGSYNLFFQFHNEHIIFKSQFNIWQAKPLEDGSGKIHGFQTNYENYLAGKTFS
jgi:hypothetical protein